MHSEKQRSTTHQLLKDQRCQVIDMSGILKAGPWGRAYPECRSLKSTTPPAHWDFSCPIGDLHEVSIVLTFVQRSC